MRKELIDEKGIDAACADEIGEYAKMNGKIHFEPLFYSFNNFF